MLIQHHPGINCNSLSSPIKHYLILIYLLLCVVIVRPVGLERGFWSPWSRIARTPDHFDQNLKKNKNNRTTHQCLTDIGPLVAANWQHTRSFGSPFDPLTPLDDGSKQTLAC